MSRLLRNETLLVVVDIQERLVPVMHSGQTMEANAVRVIIGCHELAVPMVVTEQYVRGLGPTTASVREALEAAGQYEPISKSSFSSHACGEFQVQLRNLRKKQVLLCGVEAHVCVYQTATDLVRAGYEVHLLTDAISSRSVENKEAAIRRMTQEGVRISSTEMALFELLGEAGTDEFRAISRIVR